jgi:hypothetical protein
MARLQQGIGCSIWSLATKESSSMEPLKTSSFQLPSAEVVETVFVRLPGGRIVPRRADELVPRPAPPAGQ